MANKSILEYRIVAGEAFSDFFRAYNNTKKIKGFFCIIWFANISVVVGAIKNIFRKQIIEATKNMFMENRRSTKILITNILARNTRYCDIYYLRGLCHNLLRSKL